jgi:hypothetical protein
VVALTLKLCAVFERNRLLRRLALISFYYRRSLRRHDVSPFRDSAEATAAEAGCRISIIAILIPSRKISSEGVRKHVRSPSHAIEESAPCWW